MPSSFTEIKKALFAVAVAVAVRRPPPASRQLEAGN
jgi:hypothetical protein